VGKSDVKKILSAISFKGFKGYDLREGPIAPHGSGDDTNAIRDMHKRALHQPEGMKSSLFKDVKGCPENGRRKISRMIVRQGKKCPLRGKASGQ
jgi:hypothetical protein